jgi:hypothetical protein
MGRKNMKKTKSEGNGLTKKMKKILLWSCVMSGKINMPKM